MKKTILFIVLAALCLFFRAAGQTRNKPPGQIITGKVTDEQGTQLPGATVRLKGSPVAVKTAVDGTYSIRPVSTNDVLVISFIGYQQVEITLSELQKQQFIIRLKNNTGVLDEVQIIAYGTTTKRLSTGDVSSVKAVDIENNPYPTPWPHWKDAYPDYLSRKAAALAEQDLRFRFADKTPFYKVQNLFTLLTVFHLLPVILL